MQKFIPPEELIKKLRQKPKRNKVDQLIQDCIEELADDRVDSGVEGLYTLATWCKTAGMKQEAWVNLCLYIEDEAAKLSDSGFVRHKIENALRKIREIKHGQIVGVH